jgi:hypothetical protein
MALVDRRELAGHEVVMLNPDSGRGLAARMVRLQANDPGAATNAHIFSQGYL